MDFGLAKRLPTEDATMSQTTATGLVVGTLHYMSPEQAKAGVIDFRSDIYSFGIVVFELFTGERPFRAATPLDAIYKHVHEPPPLEGPVASNIPRPLVPVLAKALAKNPDDRYQTVVQMAEAIRSARSEQDGGLSADLRTLSTVKRAARAREVKTVTTPVPERRLEASDAQAPARTPSLTVRHRPGTTQVDLSLAGTRSGALKLVFVSLVLLAGALGAWWWARSRAQEAALSQQPMSAGSTTSVRFNALPWARIEISPLATPGSVPVLPVSERTTPFLIWLTPGEYVVELENGGLTPPLKETVRVEAGRANEFVFTMPGYDPQSVGAF
jgi:serine/threonine-protein kinase